MNAVIQAAERWLGTPYHHHARCWGPLGGVDCIQLLCAVYEEAGIVGSVDTGTYAVDWHLGHNDELYLHGLLKYMVEVDQPCVGGVAVVKFGRTYSHGGIVVEPDMLIHSYSEAGVIRSRFTEAPLIDKKGNIRPMKFFVPNRS